MMSMLYKTKPKKENLLAFNRNSIICLKRQGHIGAMQAPKGGK